MLIAFTRVIKIKVNFHLSQALFQVVLSHLLGSITSWSPLAYLYSESNTRTCVLELLRGCCMERKAYSSYVESAFILWSSWFTCGLGPGGSEAVVSVTVPIPAIPASVLHLLNSYLPLALLQSMLSARQPPAT